MSELHDVLAKSTYFWTIPHKAQEMQRFKCNCTCSYRVVTQGLAHQVSAYKSTVCLRYY